MYVGCSSVAKKEGCVAKKRGGVEKKRKTVEISANLLAKKNIMKNLKLYILVKPGAAP
jgi:hypothetical protein